MVAAQVQIKRDNPEDGTYYKAFVALYYLFNSLRARLRELIEADNTPDARTEKFAEMKQRITEFKFPVLINTLDDPTQENPYLPDDFE